MAENIDKDPMKMLLEVGSKIPFFSNLNRAEIKDLVSEVKFLTYKNKEVIFHEGDGAKNHMYYLIQGKLFVHKNSASIENSKVRIATIDTPSLFGEMMRLTGEPRSATITVGEDNTLVLAFKVKDFRNLSTISKFYESAIKELSNKLVEMNKKMNN